MPSIPARLRPAPVVALPSPTAVPLVPASVIYVVRGRPGPLDRPALPSGHPESWGAITDGTILDHAVYPFPVYPDRFR